MPPPPLLLPAGPRRRAAKLSVVSHCIKLISCSHPTCITPQPPQYYNNETLTRRSIFSPFYPRHSATGGSRARHLTPTGEGRDIHSGGATDDVCLPGFYFVKSPPRGTVLAGRDLSPRLGKRRTIFELITDNDFHHLSSFDHFLLNKRCFASSVK